MSASENFLPCRLCAEVYPKDFLIEANSEKCTNLNVLEKIYQYFNLCITKNDVLPKDLCTDCFKKVLETDEFHKQIHKAQEILQTKVEIKPEQVDIKSEDESFNYADDKWHSDDDEPLINRITLKSENKEFFSDEEDSDKYTPNSSKKEKKILRKTKSSNGNQKTKKSFYKSKGKLEEWKNYIWICNACKNEYNHVKELRNHYESEHHIPVEYTCTECYKVYNKYDLFRRHVIVHRNKHKYQCDICGKFSHSKPLHDQHLVKHSLDRKYICSTCGKSFKTQKSLLVHVRKHLPDELKSFHECDVCHKKFTSSANFATHKKIHTGIKQYTCEQCGKGFIQKNGLIRHIESRHTDGQNCPCPLCPKVFKNIYNLSRHQETHLENQPHKCEVCLRPFKHKRALIRHSRIHTNQLPFECEHCKKRFREKSYLKIHLRQHTGERPYSCIECNHHFTNDSNFIKHLKGRHGLINFSLVNQRQYPFINPTNKEPQNVSNQFSSIL